MASHRLAHQPRCFLGAVFHGLLVIRGVGTVAAKALYPRIDCFV